jgi:hypothetical protein
MDRLGEPIVVQDIFGDKWTLRHGPSPRHYSQHPTIRATRERDGKMIDVPIPSRRALSGGWSRWYLEHYAGCVLAEPVNTFHLWWRD